MNFLFKISKRLHDTPDATVLQEIRGTEIVKASGKDLTILATKAAVFIRACGLKKGDRCALLGSNSVRWVAADMALMAEGVIVVPLYVRQAPAELGAMVRDSGASRILCENQELCDA
ncbi:MAG TPA: AMP-binding protein, partial [Candidatus Acidoferrales bacterium]|nr:AMP-binding protein [Candidatus Acidoferrales bacterium]